MLKTRAYDARMTMMQRQRKTSFYMQCTGEEAIRAAFSSALQAGDINFPTYRQQGLAHRPGLAGGRHDVPGPVERKGPHERSPASGVLLGA